MKSQQLLRSDAGNVLTEKVKKIALSANDDKRLKHVVKSFHIRIDRIQKMNNIIMNFD